MSEEPETQFRQWRVTGDPGAMWPGGPRFGPYCMVWSIEDGPMESRADPEAAAREFFRRRIEDKDHPWDEGPFLHHRWVTRTRWKGWNE